jgi:hypothetical protein
MTRLPALPDPPAAADDGADTRYSSCEAAKKADKGPCHKDKDVEYAWYGDRDHDGVVCE